MKKPQTTLILLSLFTILTLISLLTVYTTHQTPTEETTTNTLCTYTNIATYDYKAILEHNIINNNITILWPGQGTIYTKILRQINITLTYRFYSTLPAQATITYSLTQTLKTATLSHEINTTTPTTTNQTQIQITIPPIIKTQLDPIISRLATETGTSTTSYYTLDITSTFTINANTTAGQITQTFTPTLTIEYKHTDQGDITTIGDLYQTKTGAITEDETITRQDIIYQRYTSYILIAISIAGLCFSTYFYIKTKPTTEKPSLEKLTSPYKELIAKTTQKPPETENTIETETLEDLAKIAEILARPILHATEAKEHTFYIIDNNTKYQYETKT